MIKASRHLAGVSHAFARLAIMAIAALAMAFSLPSITAFAQSGASPARVEASLKAELAAQEKKFGPDHPNLVPTLKKLAKFYRYRRLFSQAEAALERALRIQEKSLGAGDPGVAATLDDLAGVYAAQGRRGEADAVRKRARGQREAPELARPETPKEFKNGGEQTPSDLKQAAREREALEGKRAADRAKAEVERSAEKRRLSEQRDNEARRAAEAKRAEAEAARKIEQEKTAAEAKRAAEESDKAAATEGRKKYSYQPRPYAYEREAPSAPEAAKPDAAAPGGPALDRDDEDDAEIAEKSPDEPAGRERSPAQPSIPKDEEAPPPPVAMPAPTPAPDPAPTPSPPEAAPPSGEEPAFESRDDSSATTRRAAPRRGARNGESGGAARGPAEPEPSPPAAASESVPAAGGAPAPAAAASSEDGYDVVPVFYGTDRKVEPDPKRLKYGFGRARILQTGQALVTVPAAHKVPDIERPWALKIPYFNVTIYEEAEDPKKHFTIKEILSLSKPEFLRLVRERMAKSKAFENHALVFVHGYNTSFDNALYRTAQIAYDLKFDGAPFLYSWPSGGALEDYTTDRESAEQSKRFLREFLEIVSKETGAKNISVIAHSLGNNPLLNVLKDLNKASPPGLAISQLILAAPDVDRDQFEDLVSEFKGLARGVTLYAAANDRALQTSRWFWGDTPRAGEVTEEGPLVMDGVDTIDVTGVSTDVFSLNHSGYATHNALLADIKLLIQTGERPPEKRVPILKRLMTKKGAYWQYPSSGR